MATAESISLEETNKIRISLGLAPLKPAPEPTRLVDEDGNVPLTADDEERRAVENLKNLRTEQAKIAEQDALRQRIQKYVYPDIFLLNQLILFTVVNRARDRRALNEKLSGPTLGEPGEEEKEDLKSWIKRTKKRQRELAERKSREFKSQDQQSQEEYTSGRGNFGKLEMTF